MKKQLHDVFRLWKILKPFHGHFYFQLALIFISQLFIVGFAYVNSHLLTNLVSKNINVVLTFFTLLIALNILDILIDYIARINREKHLDQTLYSYLQEFSLGRLLNLTIEQHVEDHSALKLTIISKGETATQNIIDKIITIVLPAVTLVLLTVVTLFFYSTAIALFSIFSMVCIFSYAFYMSKKRHPLILKNRDNWNNQQKTRTEAFTHLQLVKGLHREKSFIEKYIESRLAIVAHHIMVRVGSVNVGTIRESITTTVNIITLAIAGYLFLHDAYTVGTVYLIWTLTSRVYWQISTLSNTMREIPILYADAEKYFQIMDMEPSFSETGTNDVTLGQDITVTNLSFKYPKADKNVFEDVSFTVPAGKKVAFVGASGSGKSTIIKLLLRAYDYHNGSIKIGGIELSTIDAGYLREHIGYVEQHVDLFDDTIKENIIIASTKDRRAAAEENLEEVAAKARIDQFYHRLGEKKFNTVVGERGIKLSGGERQRIGIARAIIKDPEILIFDEATSALDTENEKYVMDAIRDVSVGKTTIIIAHRLSTVRDADTIIVMDKGTVVGSGTHDELMQSSSHYQNLVAHQLSQ
jgi:ABC-type multidrug transport system fused ATPase/permease subunit